MASVAFYVYTQLYVSLKRVKFVIEMMVFILCSIFFHVTCIKFHNYLSDKVCKDCCTKYY